MNLGGSSKKAVSSGYEDVTEDEEEADENLKQRMEDEMNQSPEYSSGTERGEEESDDDGGDREEVAGGQSAAEEEESEKGRKGPKAAKGLKLPVYEVNVNFLEKLGIISKK